MGLAGARPPPPALRSALPSPCSPAGTRQLHARKLPGDRGQRHRHPTSPRRSRGWQEGGGGLSARGQRPGRSEGRLGRAGEALRATPSANSGFPQPQPPLVTSARRVRGAAAGHSPRPAALPPRRPAGAVPRRRMPPGRERRAGTRGCVDFPGSCQPSCPAEKPPPRRSGSRSPRKQRRVLGAQLSYTTP